MQNPVPGQFSLRALVALCACFLSATSYGQLMHVRRQPVVAYLPVIQPVTVQYAPVTTYRPVYQSPASPIQTTVGYSSPTCSCLTSRRVVTYRVQPMPEDQQRQFDSTMPRTVSSQRQLINVFEYGGQLHRAFSDGEVQIYEPTATPTQRWQRLPE